jgi:nicotinate-nucleotide adenylyltransferase
MRKIAIYGGSFDPPHLGHTAVVTQLLLNEPSVTEVLVVPCFEHAEKKTLSPFFDRMVMCKLAFDSLPLTTVSSVESEVPGAHLSHRVVRHLRAQPSYAGAEFLFLLGSDLRDSAPRWEGWKELCEVATPHFVNRIGDVSSSAIRRAFAEKKPEVAARYLHNVVFSRITRWGTYIEQE